jgi:hypothetical protein
MIIKSENNKYFHNLARGIIIDDGYIYPGGECLEFKGVVELRNNSVRKYQAKSGSCANCPLKDKRAKGWIVLC